MKTLIKVFIISTLILSASINVDAQSVTFQSYMSTITWAESVLLNGNELNESSPGVFDIPSADVLSGTNVIEFVSVVNNSPNGVTSLDGYSMIRTLTEINSLTSEGIIPSDLDKSGFLGINDVAEIYTKILGINPGVEFAFIHPSLDLDALDPFDFGTDVYKFEFEGADLATTDFTFDVYIHGDVNKTALFAPNGEGVVEVRDSKSYLAIDDMMLTDGATYEIPFMIESDKEIVGFQIGSTLEGLSMSDVKVNDENFNVRSYITDDIARLAVVSDDEGRNTIEGAFTINASRDGMLSEFLSQESSFFDEIVFSDLTTGGLDIEFRTVSAAETLSLEDVVLSPNPAVEEVTISFPEAYSNTTLYISNAQGQLVTKKSVSGSSATIQRDELKVAGVYIITVEQDGQIVQKKFVML